MPRTTTSSIWRGTPTAIAVSAAPECRAPLVWPLPTDVLRDAVPGDLPAIVAIYNSTIGTRLSTADTEPVSVESRVPWFEGHAAGRRPLWVLEGPTGAIDAWLSFQDFYGRPAYAATAEVSVYVD